MPDNVHLLLSTRDLPKAMQHGVRRGGFSLRLASKRDVWQRGYTDYHILSRADDADFETRRHYIHPNPVHAGLAAHAEGHPFSSAFHG